MYQMFEKVLLKNGIEAYVVEVFAEGEAYMVEFETPDGQHRYDIDTVRPDDIVRSIRKPSA